MEFNWSIVNLDRRASDGFIQVAHWNCTGADGEINSSVYATVSFEDGTPSIPYVKVTETNVLEWIWDNSVDKDAIEQSIADRIEVLKNPVQVSGLPWAQTAEA